MPQLEVTEMAVGGSVNLEHELWKVDVKATKVRAANEPISVLLMVSMEAVEWVTKIGNHPEITDSCCLRR